MENQFDISISEFFKDLIEKFGYNGKYAELLTVVSGLFLFFIVLGIFFSLKKEQRVLGLVLIVSGILTFIINDLILKKCFIRERPFLYFGIEPPGFYIYSNSFPSGHSAISSAGAFSILFYFLFLNKRKSKSLMIYSIISFVICLAVMVSRMALLHHYFTDCIVGFLEGSLIALLVNYLALIIVKQIEKKKNIVIEL